MTSRKRLVSGLRRRSLASVSPWGGGEGTAKHRLDTQHGDQPLRVTEV